jgi:hypothetical protein
MPIKRRGLGFAAAFVFVSGFLRLTGPGSSPRPQSGEPPKKEAQSGKRSTGSYSTDVDRTIRQFFAVETRSEEAANSDAAELLSKEEQRVQFLIAILPDPVHTHLGLLFDRNIAAIQLAAQTYGWVFDRAILPWDRSPHQNTDLEKRQKEIDEQRTRENYPGLMIFREGLSDTTPNPRSKVLFILVVGETPTGGVRNLQFKGALDIIKKVRGDAPPPNELSILGPSFSGSLPSLDAILNREHILNPYVFSGAVTDETSLRWFGNRLGAAREGKLPGKFEGPRFSSFQQNDHYLLQRFVDFICAQRYEVNELAVLSEDNTVYGAAPAQKADASKASPAAQDIACPADKQPGRSSSSDPPKTIVSLHFPREISFFRSAYQKAISSQSQENRAPGRPTLALDLEDTGSDDDTVAPYGGTQTPLSQEAVMLGIASELQKHRVKFIVLYATDPVDQLFIARYLRTAYPEGRVVITVPDLLFTREEDTLLRGVLGLSSYALVPGLSDRLCERDTVSQGQESSSPPSSPSQIQKPLHDHKHVDRLFSSSLTVGTYNAMIGLLALQDHDHDLHLATDASGKVLPSERQLLPVAPYAEYAGLPDRCSVTPLAWLTILGQDGFWPVAPLDADPLGEADNDTTLNPTRETAVTLLEKDIRTPDIWYSAYCLCILMMAIHAVFSWTGSTLADSEAGAQFARNDDRRTAFIVGTGALTLLLSFVGLMCARSPFLHWKGSWQWTLILSLPLVFFVGATSWDLAKLREQRKVAVAFLSFAALISLYLFSFDLPPRAYIYWLPRVVHLASGVSPILPFLLLLAGGYWWTWQSLRGVTLVDFRRPRLPKKCDLPPSAYRISDSEAEGLRHTAHPFSFEWQVYLPVAILISFAGTVVDIAHPVQTTEGFAFDAGYSLLLILLIFVFLGCLLKLVRTWFACRQILAGLDRIALRRAFSRMKEISWHSMWNPGGSTLRETYKLMGRALDNLARLQGELPPEVLAILPATPDTASPAPDNPIAQTMNTMGQVREIYDLMHPAHKKDINYSKIQKIAKNLADEVKKEADREARKTALKYVERAVESGVDPEAAIQAADREAARVTQKAAKEADHRARAIADLRWWEKQSAEAERVLMFGIECLQVKMAQTAGFLMNYVMDNFWSKERTPVVSLGVDPDESKTARRKSEASKQDDSRIPAERLPLVQVLAEEYIALIYANFLVTVLLRMRTMIVCAIGLYVFLVLSVNAYPFEPHPALQTLSVILIVLLGSTVAYVYTEMHRDPILSRLTSNEPGELGWDFWLKLASAAAIPLFSLVATQFPEINRFLFSWLQPALEAVK